MNFSFSRLLRRVTWTFWLCAITGFDSQNMTAVAQNAAALRTPPQTPAKNAIRLEAEDATLFGASVESGRAGFSGTGFVSGLDGDGDKIVWNIASAKAGLYQARIRYSAPFGEKGYDLVINGLKTSGTFAATDEFAVEMAGKIVLKNGANTIALEKGWGYYDVDFLDLVPVARDLSFKKPPATLSDAKASVQTRALMRFLVENYGQKTLSGQQESGDIASIVAASGQTPAILGGDLMDYSPSRLERGAKPHGTSEKLIQNARAGHILTLCWHWNAPAKLRDTTYVNAAGKTIEAPWWRGFYSDATTFDVKRALADPNSADYKLLLRDMDAIAEQLKKFQAARIPILWRPLHEAEGGWFWWGAQGPEPLKKLWRLMFQRFTQHHQLHNLIWVFTSGGKMDWYPGDAFVDIIGADVYSATGDPMSGLWDDLQGHFNGKKLLALSEVGGVPDISKMRDFGVSWSYFVSWSGQEHGPASAPRTLISQTYNHSRVLNRDKIPANLLAPQPKP